MTPPLVRIDAALGRIEAAVRRRGNVHPEEGGDLAQRHEALRRRVGEAVAALDDLIARESAG